MPTIRYLGHASFQIEIGGRLLLLDPWFERSPPQVKRLIAPACSASDIKRCDAIIISHEHFDHCSVNEVNDIAARTFAHVIAPSTTLSALAVAQRQRVNVKEGDRFSLLGLNFEVVRAAHPQSVEPVGYVIEGDGRRIYFAGDTYEFTNMSSIRCDVALIPIGGTFTMDWIAALTVVKKIRPRYAIPMHYNTAEAIRADANEWAARLKKESRVIEPILLSVGESFSFE